VRPKVTFDGVDLTEDYVVSDLRRPLLPRDVTLVDVPGTDGQRFVSAPLASSELTLTLTVRSELRGTAGLRARSAAARRLAAILNVSEPKVLHIDADEGLHYMAIPRSDADLTRYVNAERYEVTFVLPDPALIGMSRVLSLTSGGTTQVTVGGTLPCLPRVTVSGAAAGSGGYWRLRLDGGDYLQVPLTQASNSVTFDCAERTLEVNGVAKAMPPAADWLALEPGDHSLVMTGTGTAQLRWAERWA
jgi:predicted phage tail component-like protein